MQKAVWMLGFGWILWFGWVPTARAQQTDSLVVDPRPIPLMAPVPPDSLKSPQKWLPDPKMTLRWSLLPGGGQYYNRERWKMSLVYAGFGTAVGFAVYYTRAHRQMAHAYLYRVNVERVAANLAPTYANYLDFADDYNEVTNGLPISSSPIRSKRDALYRNQWLGYLSVAGVWALATAEAYISANMMDFDVSDSWAIGLLPHAKGVQFWVRWRMP